MALPRTPRRAPRGVAGTAGRAVRGGIPEATVARLPVYQRVLGALLATGVTVVSSEALASACGVSGAMVRKDLSHLGSYGTRGVGYEVEYLRYQISRELGLAQEWPVVIVGAGNLGHALANYDGFEARGFRIVGALDADPTKLGAPVGRDPGVVVRPMSELEDVVAGSGAVIGVIATPAAVAQAVCDRLVAAGVRSILNFAPAVLVVPPGVDVRKVDLGLELQILAFHEQRRGAAGSEHPVPALTAGAGAPA